MRAVQEGKDGIKRSVAIVFRSYTYMVPDCGLFAVVSLSSNYCHFVILFLVFILTCLVTSMLI